MGEESLSDPPLPKRGAVDGTNCNIKPNSAGDGGQNHGVNGDGTSQQSQGI